MSDQDQYRWISNHAHGAGFGIVRDEDDFLHGDNPPGASVTETYYFGFHVAEAAIHGYVYAWFHPNLGVVTAGALISRGFQRTTLNADYFDIRAYLNTEEHLDRSSGALQFPGGLRLRPLEAMRRWQVQLDAPASDTRFDLLFTAAQAPAVRADQKHFDQNMHVEGELVLRGVKHRVDCYQVRDRSWRNLRPEDPMPVPPFDWLTLTRGAEFAMNLSLFDDLAVLGNPGGALRVPEQTLQDGWVQRGGELRRIVAVDKRTTRNELLMPLRHQIVATDETGERYEIDGESIGGCNWNGWPNMIWQQNLMRFTCNGQRCWGESQEVQWHEAVRRLSRGS